MTLHLLQQPESLTRAAALIAESDSVVFMHEKLLLANDVQLPTAANYFALNPVNTDALPSHIKAIDYPELVSLTSQHAHCLSW
ncbi:hypothetical protein IB286_11615 [Spongiibacter sp. KMU-158]|uniref:tRNA 2-thiouridine synthesizing protein B n=1 Tax=Spongiibacter pelagi TaxID=2760804 RepID=A0A927GX58_9GAMM|nr:hypothetical protein [Spongiibacter pelagi]MBD2859652.1 hypothetical protein [Spongiibacter pelagi]